MKRSMMAGTGLMIVAAIWTVRADEPPPAVPAPPEDAAVSQELLAQQFRAFEQALLRLAQRLGESKKPEDRERAASLKKAIAMANDKGVDNKFDRLIQLLKASKALRLQEIRDALEQNRMVAEDIRNLLALLLADNRDAELKREKQRLADLLKQLDVIIRQQKQVRAQTESGKFEKAALGKSQQNVTKKTESVARAMDKKDKGDKDAKSKTDPKKDAPKGGQGKPQDKDQKGEGKNKPGDKGKPSDGKGKPSNQDQDANKDNKDQPSDNSAPPEGTPGKKQVQEANQFQKQAEKKIQDEKKDEASRQQDNAIKKLEEARRRLEEILRQLREEEIERLLADLQQRCQRMLQMQIEVHDGTVRVDRAIQANADKRPTRAQEQRALQLSDREDRIVDEANKAIQILEAEGSAVAFPEVFAQVRDDMVNVARRLGKADAGSVTQVIEQDIIATLKEMIEALKKAQQKLQANKGKSQSGASQDPRLIDILAELKMIRAMQVRVNSRTRVYGERYTGEQASAPDIQRELGNLAQRQEKIFEITNNIYRGDNR